MSIEGDILAVLAADSAVTALLGSDPLRVYMEIFDDAPTYPAVTFFRVDTVRERGLAGPCGYARARFQFDIWATRYGSKRAVADALRRALDGYQDATIGSASLIDESDEPPETEAASDDTIIYRIRQDYLIGHPEA